MKTAKAVDDTFNKLYQHDQLIRDVDLFNIIGSPAISLLSQDARVLVELMGRFGFTQKQIAEIQEEIFAC